MLTYFPSLIRVEQNVLAYYYQLICIHWAKQSSLLTKMYSSSSSSLSTSSSPMLAEWPTTRSSGTYWRSWNFVVQLLLVAINTVGFQWRGLARLVTSTLVQYFMPGHICHLSYKSKGLTLKKIQSSSIVDLIKLYPLGETPRKGLRLRVRSHTSLSS